MASAIQKYCQFGITAYKTAAVGPQNVPVAFWKRYEDIKPRKNKMVHIPIAGTTSNLVAHPTAHTAITTTAGASKNNAFARLTSDSIG